MSNQSDDWLRRMAAAEDEALANCTSGVLACSPEIYALMNEGIENEVTVSVPTDVVEQVKNGNR